MDHRLLRNCLKLLYSLLKIGYFLGCWLPSELFILVYRPICEEFRCLPLSAVLDKSIIMSAFFLALGLVLMWVERQNRRALIALSLAVFVSSIPLLYLYFFAVVSFGYFIVIDKHLRIYI